MATPTRKELQQLALLRLREAETLYQNGQYDGCVYILGYAVECALKACICRVLKLTNYPTEQYFKTHKTEILKRLAGLEELVTLSKGGRLYSNWSLATDWEPDRRYTAPGSVTQAEALNRLDACRDQRTGIVTWLSKRW